MGSPPSGSGDIFDFRKLKRLVALMDEHDLSELELRQGTSRVRLRRGPEGLVAAAPVAAPAQPAAAPATPPPSGAAAADAQDESHLATIDSPMVGTFYRSSSPDSPPFADVGDHVNPDSTVCIVEAMKVFNEIPAEASGKIVAALVEDGQPVEFGQPLFKIDTSA